jgi:hypothetical protein
MAVASYQTWEETRKMSSKGQPSNGPSTSTVTTTRLPGGLLTTLAESSECSGDDILDGGEGQKQAFWWDLECAEVGAAARFQRCRSTSRLEVVIQINGCQTRRFDVCSTDSDGSRRGSASTPGSPLPALRKGRSSTAYHSLQPLFATAWLHSGSGR